VRDIGLIPRIPDDDVACFIFRSKLSGALNCAPFTYFEALTMRLFYIARIDEHVKKIYLVLVLIIIVGILSSYFHFGLRGTLPWRIVYSDIVAFYQTASAPGFPYLSKDIEYPVLTGLFIHMAGFVGSSMPGYLFVTAAGLITFALISTITLLITKDDGLERLLLFWVMAPSMFVFLVYNWDIMTIMFVIVSFYLMIRKRDNVAAFFLAIGFSCKFYPIIYLLPVCLKKNNMFQCVKVITIFITTSAAINIYFVLMNFGGWFHFFRFNSIRPPNPDSIWGIIHYYFPSIEISYINLSSLFLFGISSLIILWKTKKEPIIKMCYIITLLFLLTNKVFSPQYILWILPFFVLYSVPSKETFYYLEIANLGVLFFILQYLFSPSHSDFFLKGAQIFVVLRHVVLFSLLFTCLKIKEKELLGSNAN
jgi:uncharacterized membrane protein